MTKKLLSLFSILFLTVMSCSNPKQNTTPKETNAKTQESKDSIVQQNIEPYRSKNIVGSSFWGDTIVKFDTTRFFKLIENDSLEFAHKYLEDNKPLDMDSENLNIYKSNLSNILIKQRKFKEAIIVLSEVINTQNSLDPIAERLLRSGAYTQIGQIENTINDLTYVIEHGGRYRWRAYRQRGIIKYEILKDSVAGCKDLRKGVANDFTKKIYKKYCK